MQPQNQENIEPCLRSPAAAEDITTHRQLLPGMLFECMEKVIPGTNEKPARHSLSPECYASGWRMSLYEKDKLAGHLSFWRSSATAYAHPEVRGSASRSKTQVQAHPRNSDFRTVNVDQKYCCFTKVSLLALRKNGRRRRLKTRPELARKTDSLLGFRKEILNSPIWDLLRSKVSLALFRENMSRANINSPREEASDASSKQHPTQISIHIASSPPALFYPPPTLLNLNLRPQTQQHPLKSPTHFSQLLPKSLVASTIFHPSIFAKSSPFSYLRPTLPRIVIWHVREPIIFIELP
ncbi:hypothetical protein BJ508DRAFT_314138 [Ascobolus immersus RN42]|uniref:Uncharacterized protein n=1 Tax=Ascobolus immersus RN42 TaxID=1160509 RepID=A0A3N4HJI8_ASCIM|nr:hypothetical protein BJ508DRAFT_314138 [Ascobolus immersus RN42]